MIFIIGSEPGAPRVENVRIVGLGSPNERPKFILENTTDRQNLNFVGFYFYLFVYQLLAVFIFVLLKTYPLSK